MKEKLLSISIAAYNIEKYITHTLSSFLIPEIMPYLEVIIVNDGSTDRTLELAKKFENKYVNVFKVIDKPNGGYGSTINCSSRIAEGKYYKTIDGDDWVDREGMINFIEFLKSCNSDIVVSNYSRVNDKDGTIIPTIFQFRKEKELLNFDDTYNGQELYMQALTFKTSILKHAQLNITEKCFYTDIEYILTPMKYVNTISYINENVYMYRIAVDEQSMSIKGKRKHINEQLTVLNKMIGMYNSQSGDMSEGKRKYYNLILSDMVKSHITAILSLKTSIKNFRRLASFDKGIKLLNEEIFSYANKYKVIRLLRSSRYLLYWIGSPAYKMYKEVLKK